MNSKIHDMEPMQRPRVGMRVAVYPLRLHYEQEWHSFRYYWDGLHLSEPTSCMICGTVAEVGEHRLPPYRKRRLINKHYAFEILLDDGRKIEGAYCRYYKLRDQHSLSLWRKNKGQQ